MRAVIIDDVWTGPTKEGCPSDLSITYRIEGTNGLIMGDIGWCQDPYTTPSRLKYAQKGDESFTTPKLKGSWFPDAFAGTMQELLNSLYHASTSELSGQDNLQTLALVEAAALSAQESRRVELSEFLPSI